MKKNYIFTLFIIIAYLYPVQSADAYSYGDPNEEKVAVVYKQMVEKLEQAEPDFAAAKNLYLTIKDEEIDLHMGPAPSKTILSDLAAKDKAAVIDDMEKILVLNVARRLDNVEKVFEDYNKSKTLLAKSYSNYQALAPKIKDKDPELDQKLKTEFDIALETLGNPGLFGVGEKKSDFEQFKKSKQIILTSLQSYAGMESLDVGHFVKKQQAGDQEVAKAGKSNWTDTSKLSNWLPLVIMGVFIIGIAIYFVRKKR